jgi:hypothetical protein
MPAATPEERVLSARIAAAERWARTPDRSAATAPARAGLRAKFAREIDPDGTLPADELEKRIDLLVSAHMTRMSLRAARARRRAREQAAEAERAEAELAEFTGGRGDVA